MIVRCAWSGVRAPELKISSAGLQEVAVKPIDIPTPFADFDDYWQPFLGGQGPGPAYAMSLDEAPRARLRDRIKERLPTAADGTILLTARVWAVRASVGPRESADLATASASGRR